MSNRRQHGSSRRARSQPRQRQRRPIPTIYWLFGVGAFFIGASAFQLVHLGRLGHPLAYVAAVVLVFAYVGGSMFMAVRVSHDDDEWKWF